jgi:hypothetical protein
MTGLAGSWADAMSVTYSSSAEQVAAEVEVLLNKYGFTMGSHGWDRITFHMELTVRELREIAAGYGVEIRPKASRDEVARIFRQNGLAT